MNSSRLYGSFAKVFLFFATALPKFKRLFFTIKISNPLPPHPKILLCCRAALGDTILAISWIDHLLELYPTASLGFLCTKISSFPLEGHPKISTIHYVPTWRNPTKGKLHHLLCLSTFWFRYYPKAIQEIQKAGYDMSIELHPFFPDSVSLCKKARIPHRVGFTSSGSSVWLTNPRPLPSPISYLPRLYPLLIGKSPSSPPSNRKSPSDGYIVLHAGSLDHKKLWNPYHWHSVGQKLIEKGYHVYLTGRGAQDAQHIKEIGLSSFATNLCNRHSFAEFSSCIEKAALVLSIDSASLHLASLYNVPFVGLYLHNPFVDLWLPDNLHCHLLIDRRCRWHTIHPRARYLTSITPSDVLSSAYDLLS